MNKITQNRIFPLADRRVYKNLTRNRIDDRFNRPVPLTTRASVPLRPSGFADIHDQERESFHCSMGPILAVAQFFGILPIAGVNSESPRSLVFKIYDPRTIYAFLILLVFVLMVVCSVGRLISTYHPEPDKSDQIQSFGAGIWIFMFYCVTTLNSIFFIWLAAHWKKIQEQWRAMEQLLDRGKHEPTRLRSKFTVITSFIVIHSFLQYVMGLLSPPLAIILSGSNVTFSNVLHAICLSQHPYLLEIVDYNLALGIAVITIISVAAVVWNFMNLFALLISCGLVERYKSLNKSLQHEISTRPGRIVWSEFRERYATLSKLVKNVDHHTSPIILLLFLNNIYFLCLQLFLGISGTNLPTWRRVEYLVLFLCNFIRTSAVILLAAQIDIQSKNALPDIYLCPESAYNSEAQRLQQQLSLDHVYLTGMKFFPLTRNMMVAIVGTMVTYEVLLLNLI